LTTPAYNREKSTDFNNNSRNQSSPTSANEPGLQYIQVEVISDSLLQNQTDNSNDANTSHASRARIGKSTSTACNNSNSHTTNDFYTNVDLLRTNALKNAQAKFNYS
jgi:hypothetical protein